MLRRSPRRASDELAERGEATAAKALEARGYRILERRVRTRYGELDLVAEKGDLVVFVEVKTRRSTRYGAPAEAVGPAKAEHIRRSVASLVRKRRGLRDRPLRIDVVEVLWPEGREPEITHIQDAIDGGSWSL